MQRVTAGQRPRPNHGHPQANLDAAHRGYAYQDLLVACKLVDVLFGTIVERRNTWRLPAPANALTEADNRGLTAGSSRPTRTRL